MSNPTPPRRNRRIFLVLAGVVVLCVCGVVALVALSLTTLTGSAPPVAMATSQPSDVEPLTPTRVTGAVNPTSPPRATPAATSGDTSTATPAPTLAVVQPASGELHLDYPITLRIDKDEIVQLEIIPDNPVALVGVGSSAPAARLLIESGANDAPRKSVSYAIPLYPAMSAELATAQSDDLTIVAGTETKQAMDPFDRNFWTWSLVAQRGGEYRVTLRVFGYNALADADPQRQVVNDTRIIRVPEPPFLERLMTGLSENWLVLFGAGGPLALVVAVLTLWFARRDGARPK